MKSALLALLLCATTAPAQFTLQNSGTTADLRGIHSIGAGVAWASGTAGTVLRTTDDGAHWQRCITPPDADALDFRGIQAFDANTAIVMSSGKGDLSRLYKTTDGCATWKLVFTNPDKDGFFDALSFAGTDHVDYGNPWWGHNVYHPDTGHHLLGDFGYLLGDPVNGSFRTFQTWDKGSTWEIGPNTFAAKTGETAFAASNQSLVTMDEIFFVTGGTVTRLLYSYSRCEFDGMWCHNPIHTKQVPIVHGNESSGAFAMAILDDPGNYEIPLPYTIVIVGGDYKHPDATTGVAATVYFEGFRFPSRYLSGTARAAHTPPHGYRSAVAYYEKSKTWITVGPNGTDVSTDDGRNWRALTPTPADAPGADKNWNALSLPFVVGPHGRIGKLRSEALQPPTKSQ